MLKQGEVTYTLTQIEEWAIPLAEGDQPWEVLQDLIDAATAAWRGTDYRDPGIVVGPLVWAIEERDCQECFVARISRISTSED
jgi:hypothetical protein